MAKFNDNAYKFSPEEIDRKMSKLAQNAVKTQFNDAILLSEQDIRNIMICMAKTDIQNRPYIQAFGKRLSIARKEGYAQVKLLDRTKQAVVDAIASSGDTREMFDTLRDFMKWYGLIREKSLLAKDISSGDNRPGVYEEDQYDGTHWYEFVDQTMPNPEESLEAQEEEWKREQMEYSL